MLPLLTLGQQAGQNRVAEAVGSLPAAAHRAVSAKPEETSATGPAEVPRV